MSQNAKFVGTLFLSIYPTVDVLWFSIRVVFKWPSKVITWLRLLRLVIGLKESHQFFSQWEAKLKPKPIAACTRDFSRASSEFQIIARNCDWFIVLFVPVVIGRSNCFGFGFSTVIWKPLYPSLQFDFLLLIIIHYRTIKLNHKQMKNILHIVVTTKIFGSTFRNCWITESYWRWNKEGKQGRCDRDTRSNSERRRIPTTTTMEPKAFSYLHALLEKSTKDITA